jgi:hypothetical protein
MTCFGLLSGRILTTELGILPDDFFQIIHLLRPGQFRHTRSFLGPDVHVAAALGSGPDSKVDCFLAPLKVDNERRCVWLMR